MADHQKDTSAAVAETAKSAPPVILKLGSVSALTGKQPRGHKEDSGAAGGNRKDKSESGAE